MNNDTFKEATRRELIDARDRLAARVKKHEATIDAANNRADEEHDAQVKLQEREDEFYAYLQTTRSIHPSPIEAATSRLMEAACNLTEAEADCAAMRSELKSLEWRNSGSRGGSFCPNCGGSKDLGTHSPVCSLGNTLKVDHPGAALLEQHANEVQELKGACAVMLKLLIEVQVFVEGRPIADAIDDAIALDHVGVELVARVRGLEKLVGDMILFLELDDEAGKHGTDLWMWVQKAVELRGDETGTGERSAIEQRMVRLEERLRGIVEADDAVVDSGKTFECKFCFRVLNYDDMGSTPMAGGGQGPLYDEFPHEPDCSYMLALAELDGEEPKA